MLLSNQFYQEENLENGVLELLEDLGYEVESGPEIGPDGHRPERKEYSDVVLKERFKEALLTINHEKSESAIDEVIRQVLIPGKSSLLENNKTFHEYIKDGVTVSYKKQDGAFAYEQINIFDTENIENNDFLALNQFVVIENNVRKIPDVVIFVNGLPLVVIELKSASNENVNISDAYHQIKTYQKTISDLFNYNAFSIISDGLNARAGTLTAKEDWYMPWRMIDEQEIDLSSIPQLHVLLQGMLNKSHLLDLIKHFITFQSNGDQSNKILAGYHQFFAVNKAVNKTYEAVSHQGDRRIGVIWHTQGSGKSLSMVFYSGKLVLSPELGNPTLVVITDRNDLDDQLFGTFSKSSDLLRNNPIQAESREHLKQELNGRASGGIIFTTIHKFAPEGENTTNGPLTDRRNVVVIADEAHRSQYGFEAKVSQTSQGAFEKFGLAKYMRDSLPNASFIGFTGTPVELVDKNTKAVFGDYIDIYDMTQSVEDGTTVKIFYESRIAKLDLTEEQRPVIDDEFEEITEYQENIEKDKHKRKWARLEAIVGSKERLNNIAKDIVSHFEERQAASETVAGTGMIVAMSRRIAVALYEAITSVRPQWHSDELNKGKIKVVMTSSSSDPHTWGMHKTTKAQRDQLSKRLKDENDDLELVIVRDMWLTGFDVPSMHTMYIDKPMKGHNLMQAIARVNRVFREKQGGLIVDYIGIADSLKHALSQYTESDRKTTGVDTDQAVNIMLEKLDIIHDILHGHDYSKFFTDKQSKKLEAIVETVDYVISLRETRKDEYLQTVTELSKAFSLCATTDEAQAYNAEIGFHKSVKSGLLKIITNENKRKTTAEIDMELNQLISKSLKSDEVIDVIGETGLAKPNIAVLSDEFLEEFKNMEHKNLAVELLNKLIKGKIKSMSKKSLVKSRKFSEMLEDTINKYQNRAVQTTMVIQELIDMAKDITDSEKVSEGSGLSEDEYAFYEALSENISAQEVMGDETLKKIAQELTEAIKKSATVDWHVRESVRAKMRMTIRRLLKKYDYPPDDPNDPTNYDKSVKLIMDQTELLTDEILS